MFTGIIQATGKIETITPSGEDAKLRIQVGGLDMSDVQIGDSIAVNGVCLTVVTFTSSHFDVHVSKETLNCTVGLDAPRLVNLEKALRLSDRLGGHLVSGHVDGVGEVFQFNPVDQDAYGSWLLRIKAPKDLAPFLAYKGSIVVNGVSLTVNTTEDTADACIISINLIPHTLQSTTLGKLQAGDCVNLEVDLIARYVARMLESKSK